MPSCRTPDTASLSLARLPELPEPPELHSRDSRDSLSADNFLYVFKTGPVGPAEAPAAAKGRAVPPTPAPLPSARPSAQAAPTQPDRPEDMPKRQPQTALVSGATVPGVPHARGPVLDPTPIIGCGPSPHASRAPPASQAIEQARPLTRTPPVRGWLAIGSRPGSGAPSFASAVTSRSGPDTSTPSVPPRRVSPHKTHQMHIRHEHAR